MFKDKVFVITGSAQGIGKETAILATEKGAKVIINSRTEEKVAHTVEEIQTLGGDAFGLAGDVSDYEFCKRLNEFALEKFGKIDYLINNAAISTKGTLRDSTPEALENAFRVNLFTSLYASKAMMDEIIKQKGGILFISSLASVIGLPSYLSYSTTKRAMVTVAECLKNELLDDDVFV
ncbi:MAG: SDR family NAD(P)-dependent oxidoreductase, partial [Crocinitomicaceae bacterium]